MSNVLLMFSGGVDSLGALYLLLTDEKYKDYNIHVHHLHLHNIEQRHYAEKDSVDKIVQYLKDNQYRVFEYTESLHYFPTFKNNFPYDSDMVLFAGGIVCLCDNTITHYASGITLTDIRSSMPNGHVNATRTTFDRLVPNVKRIYPVEKYTKEEIINFLPKDLLALAWSCRTPIYDDNETAHPCNRCKTCMTMKGLK